MSFNHYVDALRLKIGSVLRTVPHMWEIIFWPLAPACIPLLGLLRPGAALLSSPWSQAGSQALVFTAVEVGLGYPLWVALLNFPHLYRGI